jgi:hypothetical protein
MRFCGMNFPGLNVLIGLGRARHFGINDNQPAAVQDFFRATVACDGYHNAPPGVDADANCGCFHEFTLLLGARRG